MKNLVRKFIPEKVLTLYHLVLAFLANLVYGSPSEKLIVIGVTGTNGKSTTVNLIAKILDEAGFKSAASSTVNFKIGDKDELNNLKMTMPGRFFLQRFLSSAVKQNCTHMVLESSSQGILQHRHVGVNFDVMVFTNLTPEHIEAHGGFENYKKAKLEYFINLVKLPHKKIGNNVIPKTIVANADDNYAGEFINFKTDKIVLFGNKGDIKGESFAFTKEGVNFRVGDTAFNLKLKGAFDFYNALAAIATANALGVDLQACKRALEKIENVPGRMELINEGQNFDVLVDYAPEPESVNQLYKTVKQWGNNKIIHLLGSTGGGRDVARRKILGEIAGQNADIVVVTNEDPYDDDPQEIIHQVADGAVAAGKVIKTSLFREPDRRKAIARALSFAGPNDLVLLTGKGSEQKMAVKGGYVPWDDRTVAREELSRLLNKK